MRFSARRQYYIVASNDGDVSLRGVSVVKCVNFENRRNLKLKIMGN